MKITAIGGYGEVGRNSTYIEVNGKAIILDMGLHMDHLLTLENDEPVQLSELTRKQLDAHQVLPDDSVIDPNKVMAIIPSHGHLDHMAAIPFLEKHYNCPIYATPFTAKIIERQITDNTLGQKNKIIPVEPNTCVTIGDFQVHFFPVTHSIPHTAILAVKTKEGTVVYANDFKLDPHSTKSQYPNLSELKKIAGDVKVLISECLYAHAPGHNKSESDVVPQLEAIFEANSTKPIFFSTFSSHIERLETLVALAKQFKREVIFLGRSLDKYTDCAQQTDITSIRDDVEIVAYRAQVKRRMKTLITQDMSRYVICMTGHQGEEFAVLAAMLRDEIPNPMRRGDPFIFSCNTIPTPSVIEDRAKIEKKMERLGIHIYKDVHVSGHANQEDLKLLVQTLKPKHVIPSHGEKHMMEAYRKNVHKDAHFLYTGKTVEF